jgi:hypothetical protein
LRQSQQEPVKRASDSSGGTSRNARKRETGCPGVAASSPSLLFGAGETAGSNATVAGWLSPDDELAAGFGKSGARLASAFGLKRSFQDKAGAASAVTKAEREHTSNAALRWLASEPHSNFWLKNLSGKNLCHGFSRIATD